MAILAISLLVIGLERFDRLVVSPVEERNCLTVDALISKFTFSGIEPVNFTNLSLFNWAITLWFCSEPLYISWTLSVIGLE
jgi:hypothetical protein